jgi:hypothetical protein
MGSVVGAAGSLIGGIAQSNAASYQAAVAQNNAQIENQNATYAQQAGGVQAFNQALQNRGEAGRIKANQAAAGVDVNSGSALSVQQSQREVGLQNVQTTQANANRQAYGYRVQAVSDNAQAQLDELQGQNAITSGVLQGAGGIIGGIGQTGNSPSWIFNQLTAAGGGQVG